MLLHSIKIEVKNHVKKIYVSYPRSTVLQSEKDGISQTSGRYP